MSPPRLPPQESFESVFSLQGPVEPDHENHITSSFSVLDIITDPCSENLDIHAIHSKRPSRKNNAADVYKGNMSCFSLAGIGNDLGHIALSPTPQENHAIAGASITVLSDSRAATQLGNSSNSSTTASSIYSHSLLQPIHVPVTRLPSNTNRRIHPLDVHQSGTARHDSEENFRNSFKYKIETLHTKA